MDAAEWLNIIYTKSEDEVINMIQKQPELICLPLKFSCLMKYKRQQMACQCCVEFETLKSEKTWDVMMSEFTDYLKNGYCQHFPLNEDADIITKTRKEYASIYCIHIAVALGKKRLVKSLLSKLKCFGVNPREYQFRYSTEVHKLNPLHIALLHNRKDMFELIIKKCIHFINTYAYHYIEPLSKECYNYENCLAIAAGYNAVSFLQIIFHYGNKMVGNSDIADALCKALLTSSYESAELLVDKLTRFSICFGECSRVANIVLNSKDDRRFSIFLKIKNLDFSVCLQRLIGYEKKDFVANLLKKAKKQRLKLERKIPFIIQAVLHNNMDIINLLLEFCERDNRRCYNGYSAADWARLLGYEEAERVLKSEGIEDNVITYPPLLAIFDFYDIKFDLCGSVKRLAIDGEDVNAETPNGITPFIRAMEIKGDEKYPIMRTLLLHGADPFKGIACTRYFGYCDIRELLYCNVDICKNNFETSLFKRILFDNRYNELSLILKNVHTISKPYKKALAQVYELPEGKIAKRVIRDIDEFLTNPRPLLVICRNSVRQFYGYNIHNLVKFYTLPLQVQKILTLENELYT